jgi:hypothetical protein
MAAVDTAPTSEDLDKAADLLTEEDGYEPTQWAVAVLFARLRAVREIHKPFGIYDVCGHEHTQAELDDPASPVVEVDGVGLSCADGMLYRVCSACCLEPGWAEGFQLEHCAARHRHTVDGPVCPTVVALDGGEVEGWT